MSDAALSPPDLREVMLSDEDLTSKLNGLAQLATIVCGAPIGLVSLVEADGQKFVGRAGVEVTSSPREHSFCAVAMNMPEGLVVSDALGDPRFNANPLVTGAPGIRFYAGRPLLYSGGVPIGSLCVIDTEPRANLTEDQHKALELLSTAAMAMIDRWHSARQTTLQADCSKVQIDDLQQRFNVLADALPHMVWSTPADGMSDYFSRQWCDYTGQPEEASFGAGWMTFVHPNDVPVAAEAWHEAVASGKDYETRYRLRRGDGQYRWMIAKGLPLRDQTGAITRWIGTCTDVQNDARNAEKLELLSEELSHRIKNIFAVISGLVSMTRRTNPQFETVSNTLLGRILSLSRAHELVLPQSAATGRFRSTNTLENLLEKVLSPYRGEGGERLKISVDHFDIDDSSATPLALVFHELATNSMKYGALGGNSGHVTLTCGAGTNDESMQIIWAEHGGPAVTPPTKKSFGYRLIELSATNQLGGEIDFDWQKNGLIVTLNLPRKSLMRA